MTRPVKQKQAIEVFKTPQSKIKPWYPQRGESAMEYMFFKTYLDMGAARNIKVLSQITKQVVSELNLVAKDNNWEERLSAWDQHILEVEFQARDDEVATKAADWEQRRNQIREQAFSTGNLLIKKALEMLEFPLDTVTENFQDVVDDETGEVQRVVTIIRQPAKWAMRDAANIVKAANELQRLAADMSTSNVKMTIEERRVELTVKMILHRVELGQSIEAIRSGLITDGFADSDVDLAIRQIQESGMLGQAQPRQRLTITEGQKIQEEINVK